MTIYADIRYDRHVKINGDLIRDLREKRGMTGAQFADTCGLSPQHLSDVERGRRNPSPPVAKRIADALERRLEDIAANAETASAS